MKQDQRRTESIVISTKGRNLPKQADERVASTTEHADEQVASTMEHADEQVAYTMEHAAARVTCTIERADEPDTNNMLTDGGVRLGRFLPSCVGVPRPSKACRRCSKALATERRRRGRMTAVLGDFGDKGRFM